MKKTERYKPLIIYPQWLALRQLGGRYNWDLAILKSKLLFPFRQCMPASTDLVFSLKINAFFWLPLVLPPRFWAPFQLHHGWQYLPAFKSLAFLSTVNHTLIGFTFPLTDLHLYIKPSHFLISTSFFFIFKSHFFVITWRKIKKCLPLTRVRPQWL